MTIATARLLQRRLPFGPRDLTDAQQQAQRNLTSDLHLGDPPHPLSQPYVLDQPFLISAIPGPFLSSMSGPSTAKGSNGLNSGLAVQLSVLHYRGVDI